MERTLILNRKAIIFGVPISLFGILILLMKSSVLPGNEALVLGITADLVLTVPLIYFLLIRKTEIPKTAVIPIMVAGLLIGSYFLPEENKDYLNFFKIWILPIVEISVLFFIIYKVRKGIKLYKSNKTEAFDFFPTLKKTCYDILPKGAVIPIVTEIAVFYYGFIYWKRRELKANEFSYHKESGTVALLGALIFIIGVETVVLHILLSRWSVIAAWILTFLSIYSGIQIFGFLKSMFKRPISIENDRLYLRYGIMTETTIDLKDIDSIEISSKDIDLNNETKKLSFLGELESHNIIIRLKNENELVGLYGTRKKYKNLAMYVDDKTEFTYQIKNALQKLL